VISLNDAQLKTVMAAAAQVPHEKRDMFLQRIAAILKLRGRFGDDDVGDAVKRALVGMIHENAA
jgi:hypothetical protein